MSAWHSWAVRSPRCARGGHRPRPHRIRRLRPLCGAWGLPVLTQNTSIALLNGRLPSYQPDWRSLVASRERLSRAGVNLRARGRKTVRIGIYGVSSQSGGAYFADLAAQGALVYGYARPSEHGRAVVDAIRSQGGIRVDRPEGEAAQAGQFVPLLGSAVGHDLDRLARTSDLILFTHPS